MCGGGEVPGDALWFSVRLNRQNAPWAYAKGEPFRTIAALELFASLLCWIAFAESPGKAVRGR